MSGVISAAHVTGNDGFKIYFAASAAKLCEAFFSELLCLQAETFLQ